MITDVKETVKKKEAGDMNALKNKNGRSMRILIIIYLAVWVLGVLVFWLVTPDDAGILFSLAYFWIMLPVATFVVSFFIGRDNYRGKFKWLAVIGFGVMYMLGEYATFSLANNIAFHKINVPEFPMIFYGAIISLAGMGIGSLVSSGKNAK